MNPSCINNSYVNFLDDNLVGSQKSHSEIVKARKPSMNYKNNFKIETVKKGQLLNTNFFYSTYYKHKNLKGKGNIIN